MPFISHVDSPKTNEKITTPFVLVSGWIAAPGRQVIQSPHITSDDEALTFSVSTIKRPDVEAAYPQLCSIGFQEFFTVNELASRSDWSIRFAIEGKQYRFPLHFSISAEHHQAFLEAKRRKLEKIRRILVCPDCKIGQLEDRDRILNCLICGGKFDFDGCKFNFLSGASREYDPLQASTGISSNDYDSVTLGLIDQFSNGLVLDNGCGLRKAYYENVITLDIADYPTTDVVAIGESLPFKTDTFDAVLSLSVLEHVRNPFECAREIVRVLKKGGVLYAAVPFLQPVHAYPNHYYNMTLNGLKNLFSQSTEIQESGVGPWGLPIWCLNWFLNSYVSGLPPEVGKKFKNLKISDLLGHPTQYLQADFVKELSQEVNIELACATYIIGNKK